MTEAKIAEGDDPDAGVRVSNRAHGQVRDRWNQQDDGCELPREVGAEVEDDRDLSGDGFPFP